jgi:hypothetical protein
MTIRFRVLRNWNGPAPPTELFLKTYSATSNNPNATPKAVVDGWNRVLGQIMSDFESDLRASLVAAGLLSGGPGPSPETNRTPAKD